MILSTPEAITIATAIVLFYFSLEVYKRSYSSFDKIQFMFLNMIQYMFVSFCTILLVLYIIVINATK